jgi:polar amino acid transport system ATP-binding protein
VHYLVDIVKVGGNKIATRYSAMNAIEFEKVNKWYNNFHALKDITLQVRRGEILVVCGP